MLEPFKAQRVRRLKLDGVSIRQIAQEVGVSRNTARRYLRDDLRGFDKALEQRSYQRHKLAIGNQAKLGALFNEAKGNCAVILRRIREKPEKFGLPHDFEISERSVRRYYSAYFPELEVGLSASLNR